jgi:hypothetical protein
LKNLQVPAGITDGNYSSMGGRVIVSEYPVASPADLLLLSWSIIAPASLRQSADLSREEMTIRFSGLSLNEKEHLQKYLPFLNGKYSTAPGLQAMARSSGDMDSKIFQIDGRYGQYIRNKVDCRKEDIHKYYVEHDLSGDTVRMVNEYMLRQMQKEYPEIFTYDDQRYILRNEQTLDEYQLDRDLIHIAEKGYLSLFDLLCSQLQEDFAIGQVTADRDWIAAIH